MKSIFASAAALVAFAPLAHAHGNLVQQAEGAGTSCLEYMLTNEPKNLVRHFKSVHTELVGDEQFTVTIALNDGRTLNYKNHSVENADDTVTWICEKTDAP